MPNDKVIKNYIMITWLWVLPHCEGQIQWSVPCHTSNGCQPVGMS